jgi:catechol 2,3-dioxygenase-like lactoylglutathione lyase family enzyme
MTVISIDHIQLTMPKGQEPQARAFYQYILGIPEIAKPKALQSGGGIWFEIGTVRIHLGIEDHFRPARKAHPALVVTDFDRLRTSLEAHGYSVTDDHRIPGVRRAFTHDPFGNRIELIQSGGVV